MEPVGSWYAAYRADGCGGQSFGSAGLLSPPPPYESVFAPLFHQKSHYGLRPPPPGATPVAKPTAIPAQTTEELYPQVATGFDQSNVWSQPQLPSPFGILPHESVIPNSFNFQQPVTPQYTDLKRIPPSPPKPPPPPPPPSTTFFQSNFLEPSYQKFDYASKPYQPPCNKDYRLPQPDVFNDRERNFLEKEKSYEECQSSPISYALMDQRGYERPKSPQFSRFTYPALPTPDSDYQRSKSSESFSSSSSSTGVECSREVFPYSYRCEWDDRNRRYPENAETNRGDPMSLVRTLQVERERTEREPPPAHAPQTRTTPAPPSLEEQLAEFAGPLPSVKPFFSPNPNRKFVSAYFRFVHGKREKAPPPIVRPPPPQLPLTIPEYPSDPRDDPRYYPLPLSSEDRSFSDEDDSTDEIFGFYYFGNSKNQKGASIVASRNTKQKNTVPPNCKKKKTNLAERATQTLKEATTNFITVTKNGVKTCQNMRGKADSKPKRNQTICANKVSHGIQATGDLSGDLGKLCEDKKNLMNSGQLTTFKKLMDASCQSPLGEDNNNFLQSGKPRTDFKLDDFLIRWRSSRGSLYPPLWRLKEGNVLQAYQHFVKDGVVLYSSLAMMAQLRPEVKEEYCLLGANVSFPSKTLGQTVLYVDRLPPLTHPEDKIGFEDYLKTTSHLQDAFEVYIQTLFSQSLDSNFLQEIYDEKDEYFVHNVRRVEEAEAMLINRARNVLGWSDSDVSVLSEYPSYRVGRASAGWSCPCGAHNASPAAVLRLYGAGYDHRTLRRHPPYEHPVTKEMICCCDCLPIAEVLHSIHHNKLALFARCDERVAQFSSPDRDTTAILNSLLAGEQWMNQVFVDVMMLWFKVEQILKAKENQANNKNFPSQSQTQKTSPDLTSLS